MANFILGGAHPRRSHKHKSGSKAKHVSKHGGKKRRSKASKKKSSKRKSKK